MDYQLAKFQFRRLSLASFIDRFRKTMMTSSWRHFMLLGFENLKFSETLYRLSSLQVSNRLVVWIGFYGGYCKRYQILPLFLLMTSLWRHLSSLSFQICIFCRAWHKLSACKFQLSRMSGCSFTEGRGWKTPPSCCTGRKKPSAFRVKL